MNCICYQQCNDKNSRIMTIIPKHTIIYYACAKATSFITQNLMIPVGLGVHAMWPERRRPGDCGRTAR